MKKEKNMKMVTAIVNRKDANLVCKALADNGFVFTKVATSGGFLKMGNVTLLIGIEDDKTNAVIEIIRNNSAQRVENAPVSQNGASDFAMTEVVVGGATIFVSDVEYYEKM